MAKKKVSLKKNSVKGNNNSKTKSATKGKKNIVIIAIVIIIVVILISKWKAQDKDTQEVSLIIDNQNITSELEDEIIIENDIVYISFEDVKKCLDKTIYFEEDSNLILTSGDKKIVALEIDSNEVEINGSKVKINGQAKRTEQGLIYIPISELENVYDIDFSYIQNTNNIVIDYYSKKLEKAYLAKNVSVKSEQSNFSKTVERVKQGSWVIYVSEEDGWAKVRTQNGNLGYVKSKNLTNFVTEREDFESSSSDTEGKVLEKDVSKENISTYKKRQKVIDNILTDAVSKEYKSVKITCKDNEENEDFERFKIEVVPILKECGISVKCE